MKNNCRQCGTEFTTTPRMRRKGFGIYCSRKCHGDYRRRSTEHHFWNHVSKNGPTPTHQPKLGPCWMWTAAKASNGYGVGHANGRWLHAHRVSWLVHHGDLPMNLCVLHKCDNKSCVRPDHLFLGTKKHNAIDRSRKGRNPNIKGENHPQVTITKQQALAILRLKKQGMGPTAISRQLGLRYWATYCVYSRRSWKHLRS